MALFNSLRLSFVVPAYSPIDHINACTGTFTTRAQFLKPHAYPEEPRGGVCVGVRFMLPLDVVNAT